MERPGLIAAVTERLLWRDFSALRPEELHAVLRLRCDVFIVEQACAFADIDGNDPLARHLLAFVGPDLVGCLRIFAPGVTGAAARIGRIVVTRPLRSNGVGRRLIAAGLAEIERLHGPVPVDLAAQSYLERFYAALGFVRISPDYLEDGIPHCDMQKTDRFCPP
ncbi:MAG: GNAT family N-acetyltransferase [Aliidongia sp.]